jgi:hypothetical protein
MTRVEITECGRTIAGDVVAFTIEWDGDPVGEVVWAMRITSDDRAETVELGVALDQSSEADGTADRQWVEGDGRRQDVEVDADLGEGEVTARFPAEVVGVAVEWPVWSAVVLVDGQVVAEQVVPVS